MAFSLLPLTTRTSCLCLLFGFSVHSSLVSPSCRFLSSYLTFGSASCINSRPHLHVRLCDLSKWIPDTISQSASARLQETVRFKTGQWNSAAPAVHAGDQAIHSNNDRHESTHELVIGFNTAVSTFTFNLPCEQTMWRLEWRLIVLLKSMSWALSYGRMIWLGEIVAAVRDQLFPRWRTYYNWPCFASRSATTLLLFFVCIFSTPYLD